MMTTERSTKIVNFMTTGTGVLVLGRTHISHIVKIHYFFKNLFLYSQAQIRQTKYIIMTNEGSTIILNFMTPGAGILVLGRGHINHILKMHYFYKNRFLYSQAQIRQTKYVVMMNKNKEESTEIVNFMIPESGVLVIGRGHISHIVKMHFSF